MFSSLFFSLSPLIAGCFLTWLSIFSPVHALGKTDTITWGGSNDRTGYQSNHNMDPAIVGSPQFGLLFKTLLPGTYTVGGQKVPEQIFSQPLVYTATDGVQYVYIATTQNNLYKMNAKTGAIVTSRNLHRPFLVSDLDGCTDINPLIGVTATGVIDPATDTWYLTSKTYADQSLSGATGKPNGRYYIHAISTIDLSERPNFPVNIEGVVSRNNAARTFGAGIHHQRPGLLQHGQYIYAGFASHCAQYNFTGWIIGWDKSSGKLVEQFSTQGAGVTADIPGAGVWMSGGGLAGDDKGSMFFATGNGYASQLNGVPVNGRSPPTALEEAAVHMAISDDGTLSVVDFFMPWEKTQLDGADKDLGTTPLELLPSQFQCGSITRMGVVTGKSGKTYFLNLDDLGGYSNGPSKQDRVIQVTQNENSVYAGAGVYPLEGGYIYISVIQYPTHVFKFSCNGGVASFDLVADSPDNNAYVLGVGHGTVTSLDDQPGTGLVWTSDVEGSNLRIYNAIPSNGKLTMINSFVTPGVTKFTRPVFGDGIVYQGTTQGYIYAYGAPVSLPLNCTSIQFGTININSSSSAMSVLCQANTAVTITAASLSGNPNFAISGLPTLPYQLSQGQNFSFQARFTPQAVGPLSSSIILNTTQAATGYSTNTPFQLKGTGQSQSPLLAISPNTVSFNGVIIGQNTAGVNQSLTINNGGNTALQIASIQYSIVGEKGPWVSPNGTQSVPSVSAFTFYNLPLTIPANTGVSVTINFNPGSSGNYAVFVQIRSTGGTKVLNVLGTGSEVPRALVEFESPSGGWTPYSNSTPFSFGNVTENTSRNLRLRITNSGGPNAAPISLTVSKPPFGIPASIIGTGNSVDLGEGALVYANQSLAASMYCSVPKSQINVNSYVGRANWTINLNDPTFGRQQLQFVCNAISEQAPPLDSVSQQGIYRYAGCFLENNPGRQLQTQIYASPDNTNDKCIAACAAAGYLFAGTQYNSQCWCGYNRPKLVTPDANCDYSCSGDVNEICGGNGADGAGAYISTFGDITRWNGNSTDAPGPYVNPGVFGYQSLGCYTEGSGTRVLNVGMTANRTVGSCLKACQGFTFAGVEYGGECYCDNKLGAGSVSAPGTECSMACGNDQTEYCGGPSRLNMYSFGNGPTSSPTSSISSTLSTSASTSFLTTSSTSISTLTTTTTSSTAPTGPTVPPSIGNFSYQACYTEATSTRALGLFFQADDSMTLSKCGSLCPSFIYFGVEYGRECYCGNVLGSGSVPATDGRCNMKCAGDAKTLCGGPNGLQLYMASLNSISSTSAATSTSTIRTTTTTSSTTILTSTTTSLSSMTTPSLNSTSPGSTTSQMLSSSTNSSSIVSTPTVQTSITTIVASSASPTSTSTTSSSPSTFPSVASFRYVNCYTEATNSRALTGKTVASKHMTLDYCAGNCTGFTYMAVEYSQECYCGNTLMAGAVPATDGRCSMTCAGNPSQICGGPVGLSLYQFANSTSSSSNTTLSSSTAFSSSSLSSSTIPSSTLATATSSQGLTSTSISTQQSTSVSTSSRSSTALTTTTASSTVTTTVAISTTTNSSTSSSIISSTTSNSPTSTTTTVSTTMSITTSSGTSSSTTSPSPSPSSPWPYLSCYLETNPRLLSQASTSSNAMNISLCQSYCSSQLYPLAGLEYGRECYCGTTVPSTASANQTGCNMACAGTPGEICGGSARLSVFNNTAHVYPVYKKTITSTTGSSSTTTTGNSFTFQGCYTDANRRTLGSYSVSTANMTQELCVGTCDSRGYKFAGVEYGTQCFCGDVVSVSADGKGGVKVAEAECGMRCAGDTGEWCGAGNRIGIWMRGL